MKISSLKKSVALSAAVAVLACLPSLHAAVTVTIEGGSASQNVLYDRATNIFAGGTLTVTGAASSAVRRFVGTSTNALLTGYGTITLDINVANGAVNGLQALVNQTAGPGDTNITGALVVPTFVDSATSPEAVGIDSVAANLNAYPTYVVPLVFIKNANSIDTAPITNLTQRQAVSLETATNSTRYFGGTSTNQVYFVGRNSQAAVRTEIDYNIYNSSTILTFQTNSLGQATLDTSADPGLAAGGAVANTVLVLTNAIGTVAVQNLKSGLVSIPYEGVPYSANNVINGSYPLWGYENYYFIATGNNGAPSPAQLAVLNVFYASVTNAAFQAQVGGVFTNNFIPNPSMRVSRNFDGGQIQPLPNY
jgi:phosphate transport system substrate-binding protein